MIDEQKILASCRADFAEAWKYADNVLILAGGFVDVSCLISFTAKNEAHVLLTRSGFDSFFGRLEDFSNPNFLMTVVRSDRPRFIEACNNCIASGEVEMTEVAWRVSDEGGGVFAGQDNILRTSVSVRCVGEYQDEKLIYVAMLNVSKRRKREHALSRNQYASSLVAMFTEAFTVELDTGKTEVLFANSDCNCVDVEKHVGFHACSKRVHPDDRKLFWAHSNIKNIKRTLFGENASELMTFDLRRMEDDGTYHWVSFFITRIATFDDKEQVLVCVRNLDAQKEAQRRERDLRSKAQIDALTNVYNRGATEELITAALESRGPDTYLTLIVFDVDRFKNVNDTYGHLMGDKLLKMVARSLKGICRDDDLVGRIGGDEFVALLISDVAPSNAVIGSRINRCLESMRAFSEKNAIDPPITLSAGVINIDDSITSYKEAFAKADELLYETKEAGRNGYRLYHP